MKMSPTIFNKSVTKKLANKVIKKAISHRSTLTSPKKLYKCKRCQEIFMSRWYRLKHKCKYPTKQQQQQQQQQQHEEQVHSETIPDGTQNTESPKKILKCPKCIGVHFPTELAFKHHQILHSGFKPYTCNVCNITFENETKWRNHIAQSANQSHCDECLQSFGCLIAKQRHICLENSYCCVHCGSQFKKRLAYDRHMEICKSKLSCNICGKQFVKKPSFTAHMEQIHGEKLEDKMLTSTPDVKDSPINFTAIDSLIKEGQEIDDSSIKIESETIHLNGPVSSLVMCSVVPASPTPNGNNLSRNRTVCEVCNRSFKNFRAKQVHSRIHFDEIVQEDDSPVTFKSLCEICDKDTIFKRKEYKDESFQVCETEKPIKFICTECSWELQKEVNEDLVCRKCQELFEDEAVYNEHADCHNIMECSNSTNYVTIQKKGPDAKRPLVCGKCLCSFKTTAALKMHRRSCLIRKKYGRDRSGGQRVCCLQCEKTLPTKSAFELHLKVCGILKDDGEDSANNELKRLKSTLNESALLNVSENLECNKCMKVFRTAKHLEMHDKQVHKDYQCRVCHLMFWKSEDLDNHLRVHNSTKQYKCDFCEETAGSSMGLRFHRATHFGTAHSANGEDSESLYYTCHHCQVIFESFRKFETHCKRFAIGPDGVIKVLPRRVRNRSVIKKMRSDVFAGLHVATCYQCHETFDDEELLNEHKVICVGNNENLEAFLSPDPEMPQLEDETRMTAEYDTSNYRTSPSIFGSEFPSEDNGVEESVGQEDFTEEENFSWMSNEVEDGNDSDFSSTISLIEAAPYDEPITHDSKLVHLAIKAMDICISSRGVKRATSRVRKIIKDVFKLIVDHPVTIERPHSCFVCGKLFIHPQGITNHYYQKHGSQGILNAISSLKGFKDFPDTTQKKTRRKRRKMSLSSGEVDGDVIGCRKVESNVSPRDEPLLIDLRNNISKLLCHLVSDNEVLEELGWPLRLIDDVLVDVISRCENRPCLDARKSRLSRLRENITTLLSICVKEQAMESFGWNSKPVDEVVKEMLAKGEIASA